MTRIIIRWVGFGPEFELLTDDLNIECLSVTDASKSDRVYRMETGAGLFQRVSAAEIDTILGDSPVGQLGDKPIVEQAVRAILDRGDDGKPKLSVVQRIPDPSP